MSYNRKIRIEYYVVVTGPKEDRNAEPRHLFNLENLIAKADKYTLKERSFDYYQEKARLDKMRYNSISNYWYLNFARLSQTNIPSKGFEDSETEPMTLLEGEYIGNEVTAVYDVENHIIALQRNRNSLSSTGVEYYLSELLNSSKYDIYLDPILANENKLGNAKIYRKLTMRFADLRKSKLKGDEGSSFARLFEYFEDSEASTATVTISLGHMKRGSLDKETISNTIDLINDNRGLVSSAELNIKASEVDPVDTIDLFTMKCHDFINIKLEKLETIEFENLADEIHARYNKSKELILQSLKS